ncbi:MAG: damage-inducible protein DinB [candidate division NC10 bacterium]|nr:damage-inducible protein DinB [candidate division NC10 bacterium]
MDRKDILTLYEYNAWANERALGAAGTLSPEQFLRDLGSSFPSVRDTLAHIVGAEWIWLCRWQGESPSKGLPAADFPTVASLKDRFAALDRERRAFLDTVSEGGLARPFSYRDMAGNAHSLRLVDSLQHLVNHGTYHRGQITTMLRQLGAKPVSTDMSRFYLDRGLGA